MIALIAVLAAITLITDLLLIVLWLINFKRFNKIPASKSNIAAIHPEFLPLPVPALQEYPRVDILLAVRNEADNLTACLDHLLAQDYPPDKICIWIGNDASTDNTLAIAQAYAAKDLRIHVIDIQHTMGAARARANVIAHLVRAGNQVANPADILLITDADTRAPQYWIRGMLQSWQIASHSQHTGIVTGVTLVANGSVWAQLQRIDWLFALGMVKVVSDLGFPTATLGNNMMITRQAYEATGGYESLPFSITEDFQILQEITQRGFGFSNVIDQYTATFTLPMPYFAALLQQRKRWMHGAMRLPRPIVSLLFLQALFYPLMIIWACFALIPALSIWIGKVIAQSFFIGLIIEKLKLTWPAKLWTYTFLVLYDLYAAIITIAAIIYYYLPYKTKWKDRSF